MKSQEVSFQKISEIACLSGREFGADNSPHDVYVTRHWNWMNSYWMLWIGRLRRARSELAQWAVSVIFEKWPFVIKPYFLLFEARISCVFLILLLRSIKAYLCPNMINFDAVDISEHRPEEVISFFWRSVYVCTSCILECAWEGILFNKSYSCCSSTECWE